MTLVLVLSLAANTLASAVAFAIVRKRGGLSYLRSVLAARGIVRDRGLETFQAAYRKTREELAAWVGNGPETIVLAGDSHIETCPWAEIFGDGRLRNRGLGGDTIAGTRERLARLLSTPPAAIWLMVGINDLLAGTRAAAAAADYARLLELVAARAPQTRLLVHALLPVDPRHGAAVNAEVAALNERLQALCAAQGVRFLDLGPAIAPGGVLDPACSYDGLHLNACGYQRWKTLLETAQALSHAPFPRSNEAWRGMP